VAAAYQPPDQVRAHPSKSDHSKLHRVALHVARIPLAVRAPARSQEGWWRRFGVREDG
jgi:hypothetical protein